MMRTSNPVLSEKAFQRAGSTYYEGADTMTVQGTGVKTGILLLLAVVSAAFAWTQSANPAAQAMLVPMVFGGLIVALIAALVGFFKPTAAPYAGPIYAVAEGLVLGFISQLVNSIYPGIAFQAVCLTFGTLFSLLIAYQSGWIRVTEKFRAGVFAATGAIFLIYLIGFIMSFFGAGIPYIHEAGVIGIGFSLFVVAIAALNLVLDFDFIDRGAQAGAPKYMEWYGALGLMVTLVWLYIEILHLLMKLQNRD
ncbi:MAG TPA: Bax inhibitor-1/YccA family protein [Planctomycetaceae bacterium]|nr:Bax inhibitor-1/YccA family protein [Planctomycetaceae bacterium]